MDASGDGFGVAEVEQLVVDLYRRHRLDPSEPESPWKIARLELGPNCFRRPHRLVAGLSDVALVRDRWLILIARTLPTPYAAHAVGHELGHVLLRREGVRVDRATEERLCDAIGGAILAPSPAVKALYREHGFDLRAMARRTCSTPTWAALRYGEALRVPTIVVTPGKVRTRGPDGWVWPASEGVLRSIVKAGPRGVRKVIGGGRAAFFADETAA